ncbi:glutathione S-transferase N-terminal domain-containing protein [Novosphingobium sp. G106]|uniref:glutathione binding-like protein n=1 Tax=Novosphingobium sp. G106 TaxID=2849500 RepID=UPI001C2D1A06|nr:glutathione binding-like protein [Novosphingobium sp. G106]MBV1686974.1 glutathione S-transferase N-terminal domain-containing protein [Novosphingobium sp. G106]
MKLYYSPGACSLSVRISLHEARIAAEFERVDLKAKITERGTDYLAINPKGYVPMLVLDDGAVVTENVAVLDLIADRVPVLRPAGPLGRTRLIEMLSYLSCELHIAFKPFFHGADEAGKAAATEAVMTRLGFLENQMPGAYLLASNFTVADAYLFAMLRWAKGFELPLSTGLLDFFDRILARDAVRQALTEEGLA